MPHVSRKKLKEKTALKIYDQLVRGVLDQKTKRASERFLKDLLTSTEQVMLAKRLAIIFMIREGFSIYRIHKTLQVSPSTVVRISRKLHDGDFNYLGAFFKNKKERESFWDMIEVLLRAGLPPRGRGRWKWLFEEKDTR